MNTKARKLAAFTAGLSLFVALGIHDSLWSPFLPNEYDDLGISAFQVGVVVSASEASALVSCLIAMTFGDLKHRRFLFSFGSLLLGLLCLAFSQMSRIRNPVILVFTSVLIRTTMGCGATLIWCCGSAIFVAMFPNHTGKVCSALATVLNIGIMAGPPFGSLFYSIGGFEAPFLAAGVLQITLCFINYFIMPADVSERTQTKDDVLQCDAGSQNHEDNEREAKIMSAIELRKISTLRFLRNPGVMFLSLAAILGASSTGFFIVSFSSYLLDEFEISSENAGPYFLPFTLVRAVSAPVFGILVDKGFRISVFCAIGCFLNSIGLVLLGTINYFEHLNNLICVEVLTFLIGMSATASFVALIPLIRDFYARKSGINMDIINFYNSALYGCCFTSGMVLGQTVFGGILRDHLDFHGSCLVLAIANTVTAILATAYLLRDNWKLNSKHLSSVEQKLKQIPC
ncbi:MFS-type transporter SLC18B1-like [Symsagittifera roscoffensis]|uniref:MFS-type transporter SLC18B1-like n=1 Tax=Symsagittifera roscoffensis TaxID=84072 RepID=UPI00307C6697